MQCPETPQINTRNALASTVCGPSPTGSSRSRIKSHSSVQRSSSVQTLDAATETPSENSVDRKPNRHPIANNSIPSRNFSKPLKRSHQFNDVFESRSRSSAAALQFHAAARRLALSPISQNLQNQTVSGPAYDEHPQNRLAAKFDTYGDDTPVRARHANRRSYTERDITSAQKESSCKQSYSHRSFLPPVPKSDSSSYGPPIPFDPRKGQKQRPKMVREARNFSRPKPIPNSSPAKARTRNFSRPVRPPQSVRGLRIGSHTSARVDGDSKPSLSLVSLQGTDRVDYAPKPPTDNNDLIASISETIDAKAAGTVGSLTDTIEQDQRPCCDTHSAHSSTRESFESAVSERLGDKRLQLSTWEIWLQRIVFSLLIFTVNIALGLAYLGSFKHPYILPILVFMKSKDILSTMVILLGLLHNFLRHLVWPPKKPESRWILSLVCAYAETEEQILKTVFSLAKGSTQPHKQVICVILDGKPRDILSKMSAVNITVQRPYTTWRGNRGEITVNAGHFEGIPLIVVAKTKNAGKKDSLILGHDLFNFPRNDMPQSTRLLRREIWQTILPSVVPRTKRGFEKFDFIFCTDADSTIHDQALRRLADALCRENDAIAACGVLFAEFGDKKTEYSPWHLFQQFQYTFGQYVRRQAESMWGRVTCLPGCITMIVVRAETGQAVSEYAKPVTEHNLFRHQVQYLGTDRRLTWCMMSQGKHLRTIFVPNALSETVVPDGVSHYLSQRRRWASNAYFNDFFYLLGPRQRLITRLFAAIDIVRLSLVYYRVFNTAYFVHGLITHFYIVKIIPTLIVTKTPAIWYLLLALIREPHLRRRLHKIILGMCINQVISPILSVIVFTNVIFHMGSQAWGKTGASTQGTSSGAVTAPVVVTGTPPPHGWTPRRLANSVRAAIRGVTPKQRRRTPTQPCSSFAPEDSAHSRKPHANRNDGRISPLKSHPPDPDQVDTASLNLNAGATTSTQTYTSSVACTPMRPRQNTFSTPITLTRRTPYH